MTDTPPTGAPEMRYDDLEQQLRTAPMTWIPALLTALVARAVQTNVFVDDGLARFVENARQKATGSVVDAPSTGAQQSGKVDSDADLVDWILSDLAVGTNIRAQRGSVLESAIQMHNGIPQRDDLLLAMKAQSNA